MKGSSSSSSSNNIPIIELQTDSFLLFPPESSFVLRRRSNSQTSKSAAACTCKTKCAHLLSAWGPMSSCFISDTAKARVCSAQREVNIKLLRRERATPSHLPPPRESDRSIPGAPARSCVGTRRLHMLGGTNLHRQVLKKGVELGTETAGLPGLERFQSNVVTTDPSDS